MRSTPSRQSSLQRTADFTSPLTIPGGEVAGAQVVRELPPGVALTVWQVLRTVLLWAAEIPAQRGDLFERRAMEQWEMELLEGTFDADLRYPLAVIIGELADPEAASPEHLAHACLCVTEWGLAHNAIRTALGFSEAAALCWPDHPRYAWMTGRLLRTHGFRREAEQWIKRSVRVAGNTGDWETQTLALNSLGNLSAEAGNYRLAAQTHSQALRIARKHRLRDREGEVLHDLFVATAYSGDLDAAEEYARAALEIYCAGHIRLLPLAHDVVVLWIKRGQFDRAYPVLLEMVEHFSDPTDRLHILGSAGRAAAMCGDEAQFHRLRSEALEVVERKADGQAVARAFYELGLGAWSLGRWEIAEQLLVRAEEVAKARGEADIIVEAGTSLAAVRQRQNTEPVEVAIKRTATGPQTLARKFVATLRSTPILAETH